MARIKIKNFGPIKDGLLDNDGWIDIRKVTMFIGNQGSGKSTVAKLISTFMWMEKSLINGRISDLTSKDFTNEYCNYFRLLKYFRSNTEIAYEGDYCVLTYSNEQISYRLSDHNGLYRISKIMYVPAERSFLSSVEDADTVSGLPQPLITFMVENDRSLKELEGILHLPFGNYDIRFDSSKKETYIIGADYELELTAASSGLHSAVPLFVVSRNLSSVLATGKSDNSLSDLNARQLQKRSQELRSARIDYIISDNDSDEKKAQDLEAIIESKYRNSHFVNIVEEPEQNLFPSSQKEMLYSLLEFNNLSEGNRLIMTTHSPYLINYLTLAIEANKLQGMTSNLSMLDNVYKIVPSKACVKPADVVIYELDEMNGSIKKLEHYDDLPSDENKLNEKLGEGNELFAQLLEIKQQIKHDNTIKR